MSIPAFGWALVRGAELKLRPSDRLLLIFLADQADRCTGLCRSAGQSRIEQFTGLDRKTIQAATARLVEAQLIRVTSTPGMAIKYEVLCLPTPGNGTMVEIPDPGKTHPTTPGNGSVVTPGNGTQPPREITAEPRETAPPSLSFPSKSPSKMRASAPEESQVLSFPGNGTPQPEPPTSQPPPIRSATLSSIPIKPPPDDFNAWVDGLPPKRAIPLEVEQEVVRGEVLAEDDNPPVDPGVALAVLADVRRSLQMRAYPPRAAVLSPDEMSAAITEPRRPKPSYLPDDVLAALRADARRSLARRAVVS